MATDRNIVLLEYAAAELGPVRLVRDHSWDHGEAHVIEVADGRDTRWIVKDCLSRAVFDRELYALTEWAPALGPGRAPVVRASDPERCLIIMSRLPGEAGKASTPGEFRQAGALTRLLHDAAPPRPVTDPAGILEAAIDRWLDRCPGVVPAADVDYARARMRDLAALSGVVAVPSHDDNQPRNWIVDESGRLAFIDFGRTRYRPWPEELSRMYFAEWYENPELGEAFFAGYGRTLSDRDIEYLRCAGASMSITGRLWARAHHDPEFEAHNVRIMELLRSGVR